MRLTLVARFWIWSGSESGYGLANLGPNSDWGELEPGFQFRKMFESSEIELHK